MGRHGPRRGGGADPSSKLTNDTFLDLPYGIGIKQGNVALKRWVDSRLELMRKKDTFMSILKNNVPARFVAGFSKNILRPNNTFGYAPAGAPSATPFASSGRPHDTTTGSGRQHAAASSSSR